MPSEIFGSVASGAAAGSAFGPWGAVIGGGLGLLGGMMGRENQKDQEALQREFAQSGIQWRVQDAKAAGVHPLFALGASPASYSPTVNPMASAVGQMGQDVSRSALAAQQQQVQEEQLALQRMAAAASSERDFATASAQRALAAKTLQDMNASGPVMPAARAVSLSSLRSAEGVDVLPDPGPGLEGQSTFGARARAARAGAVVPFLAGQVEHKAGEQYSTNPMNPGLGAEMNPFLSPFTSPSGTPYLLPNKPGSEALEAAGELVAPMIIARENLAHFGPEWAFEVLYGRKAGEGARYLFSGRFGADVRYQLERMVRALVDINRR